MCVTIGHLVSGSGARLMSTTKGGFGFDGDDDIAAVPSSARRNDCVHFVRSGEGRDRASASPCRDGDVYEGTAGGWLMGWFVVAGRVVWTGRLVGLG